jgi:hypothetical protein
MRLVAFSMGIMAFTSGTGACSLWDHRVAPATVCELAGSEKSPHFGDAYIAGRDGVGQLSGAVPSYKDLGTASTADQERSGWLRVFANCSPP